MARRRCIKISREPAVTITRHGLKREKVVYVAIANKQQKYENGPSPIVYIGTTRKGVDRIADSAANQAQKLLRNHGLKRLSFYVVSCTPLRNVETWKKLERALLLTFRDRFYEVPTGNSAGKKFKWRDEDKYFSGRRLQGILDQLSMKAV